MGLSMRRAVPARRVAATAALALVAGSLAVALAPAASAADPVPIASWGFNGSGQLGNGNVAASPIPVAVVTTGALAGKTIVQVSAGSSHACAVASDGTLACWGENGNGQLGIGSTTDSTIPVAVGGLLAGKSVTAVAAGNASTCAVASGAAYCWGSNVSGALGTGVAGNSNVPVAVFAGGVLAGKTVTGVAVGSYFACAIAGGGVFCWGENGNGQLGDTTTVDKNVPVSVYLGIPAFPNFLSGKTVTQVSAGYYHACARTDGGGLACWGRNAENQLGVPTGAACGFACSTAPVPVTDSSVPGSGFLAGRTVANVGTGLYFTCAATTDGAATCWGSNAFGQVGDGTTVDRATPVAVTTAAPSALAGKTVSGVYVGWSHACARGSDSSLACWGRNATGQLGVPTVTLCAGAACSPTPLSVAAGGSGAGSGVLNGASVLSASGGATFTLATTATVPSAPTGVQASAGDTKATVTWTAPAATGGQPITSYTLQKSTDNGATWTATTPPSVAAPATSLEVTGLANGTPVSFRVTAVNSVGSSGPSSPSVPVTPAPAVTVPGAPTGVTAVAGDATATLTWTAPASTGGAAITSYAVQASTDGGATWNAAAGSPVAAPATTLTVTGLANGVPVTFRVAALNSVGTGAWSSPSVAITPVAPVVKPGTVNNLTAVSKNRGKATVSWQPPSTGSTVTGYKWRQKKNNGSFSAWKTVTATTLKLTLSGLTPGATYTFGVVASNSAGDGKGTSVKVKIKK